MPDHDDHRELGYGNVDARPDIDGAPAGGGESGGGARDEDVAKTGNERAQTDKAYSGKDNPNSTRKPSSDDK